MTSSAASANSMRYRRVLPRTALSSSPSAPSNWRKAGSGLVKNGKQIGQTWQAGTQRRRHAADTHARDVVHLDVQRAALAVGNLLLRAPRRRGQPEQRLRARSQTSTRMRANAGQRRRRTSMSTYFSPPSASYALAKLARKVRHFSACRQRGAASRREQQAWHELFCAPERAPRALCLLAGRAGVAHLSPRRSPAPAPWRRLRGARRRRNCCCAAPRLCPSTCALQFWRIFQPASRIS